MRRRRVAKRVGIAVGIIAALVLAVVLFFTTTDVGRERVRRVALERIADMIEGEIEIGRIEGNLLREVRLIDVAIRDLQGRPFLEADTLATRFGLRALLRQRLDLSDLRLVNAHVILDKPPGEEWNYERIFDTGPEGGPASGAGWGDWVAFEDVTLVNTRVTVRDEWLPPEGLTRAERDAALRRALAGGSREHVVEAPGGYQNVMEFRELDARLPRVLVAHPDSAGMAFELDTLSGLVRPFSPPAARVHDFAGEFRLVNDSLFMSGIRSRLSSSRLFGGGVYALHSGDLLLIARGDPVSFPDLQWLYPDLPDRGGGTTWMRLEVASLENRIVLQQMDLALDGATVRGRLDVTTGETLRFGDTDLTFASVGTGLLEEIVDVRFPRRGEFSGELAIRGPPASLQLAGDVRFHDAAGPSSRVIARGELGTEPELRFDELRLRFRPLQAGLARAFVSDLPLRGTIEGTALLTGTPSRLTLDADLALRDPRHGLSEVRLAGGIDRRGDLRLDDMVLEMDPLRLDLLRDDLPDLPAGATARGRVVLDGVLARAVSIDGDIILDDPATGVSEIGATGTLAFQDDLRLRDFRLRFHPLQARLARALIPDLPIRGTIDGTARVTGTLRALELEAELALRDPRHGLSHVDLAGGVDATGKLRLIDMVVDMHPLRLDLLRDEVPQMPANASATGRVVLDGFPNRSLRVDGDIVLNDPVTGRSEIGATGTVAFDDGLRFGDLRVRAAPLQAGLLRPWLPDLPPGGSLTGNMRLDGDPAGFLYVDGQLAHHHPELGVSRLQASGSLDVSGPLEFRDLDVRLEPLHMALVRTFAPDLPLGGRMTGTATLNGSPDSWIAVRGDITHVDRGERSHVVGRAEVTRGPGGWAAVDVRLDPLSLDVAGRFIPAAGLQGAVSGRLRASGDMSDLTLDADLVTADGGAIRAEGTLDLAAAVPTYDLDMRLRDFDLSAVSWRAPAETDLTGTLSASGRGLEPATMDATIVADLGPSDVDGLQADQLRLRLAVASGLARLDSSLIRLDGAEALLDGSFGLVAGTDGTLRYQVAIDSLHAFASWLPGAETGVEVPAGWGAVDPPTGDPVLAASASDTETTLGSPISPESLTPSEPAASPDRPASPAALAAAGDQATAGAPAIRYIAPDGSRVTETVTLVQTAVDRPERREDAIDLALPEASAEGDADGPATAVSAGDGAADTTPPLPRAPADSLAGSLYAAGTLRGNVSRFDLDGRAVVDDLYYLGAYVSSGEAEFDLADVGTARPGIQLSADLVEVRTSLAEFDSVTTRVDYRGLRGDGSGEAMIVAHGFEDQEYRAEAEFDFSPARSELRLADLTLRFDTVTWRMPEPGVVSWADDDIRVAGIDLRSDAGGRVRLDGMLPADGSGSLDLLIEEVEIEQVVALLQLDQRATGRVDIDANIRGTLDAPRITGTARLEDARLDGEAVPDVRASFQYADLRLDADAEMLRNGTVLATADLHVPMDLSLGAGMAPRLLPGELAIDIHADSLPIQAIPRLSEQVADARGRVRGELSVRGTVDDPIVTGDMDLDMGSVVLRPLGLRLEDIAGRLTLDGDRLVVDSLVARSGGQIRVSGEIGVASLTDPTIDLEIESRETLVINTEDMKLAVDSDLTIGGSLAALEVEGKVRTRRGVIYIPKLSEMGEAELVSLHNPGSSAHIEPAFLRELRGEEAVPPLLDRMRMDITLQVDRDVWLRSTEANVEVHTPRQVGPLHIRTADDGTGLAIEGTLSTDRGEYEFMSRRFDLTRGSATFTGESSINPVLQIAAEHEVRLPGREAFDVRVLLSGTMRDLEITLESNSQPPIAQTDLLSYLAFGRSSTTLLYRQGSTLSAQGGDAGELVGNVAGLATQQLGTIAFDAVISDLEVDLMRDLHVDVFRITPADLPPDMFSGGYGGILRSTEVEAGRYVTSRLFVAGQINTGISRPGIRVEYTAPFGLVWQTSWRSQWMPSEPTLTEQEPRRAGVLGTFLLREWRF